MSRERIGPFRRPFTLFMGGMVLLAGALAAGISAVHYEFFLLDSSATYPDMLVYAYENLPTSEQGVVDAAIAGERFVYASAGALPGVGTPGFGGRMAVARGDTYYVFARQPFFDALSVNGLATVALAVAGVVVSAVAVRWGRN